MKSDKTTGPGDFLAEFYKAFKEMLEDSLRDTFIIVLLGQELLHSMKEATVIVFH